MRTVAAIACFASAICLFIVLSFHVLFLLFPDAVVPELSIPAYYLAPLIPWVVFAFLYGDHQRQTKPSKVPARWTICALCITIVAGPMLAIVAFATSPQLDTTIWQYMARSLVPGYSTVWSALAIPGVWLSLSSLLTMRQRWLPKIITLGGLIGGLTFASVQYFLLVSDIPYGLQLPNWLFQASFIVSQGALLIWSAGLGVWLLIDKLRCSLRTHYGSAAHR